MPAKRSTFFSLFFVKKMGKGDARSGSRKEKVVNYEEGFGSGFSRALVAWETAHRTGLDALSALGAVSNVGHTHNAICILYTLDALALPLALLCRCQHESICSSRKTVGGARGIDKGPPHQVNLYVPVCLCVCVFVFVCVYPYQIPLKKCPAHDV
jgi:hypothetical protein